MLKIFLSSKLKKKKSNSKNKIMKSKLIPNFLKLLSIVLIIVLIYQTIATKSEITELRKEINTNTQAENYPNLSDVMDKLESKKEWNEYILKDCSTINSLLSLKEEELERLADNDVEIHFKSNLKKYKIVFGSQIINEWTNCGFIAPVEMTALPNVTSNVKDNRIFDKFITKRMGTASWIYLNDEKIKGEIFKALKNGNYDTTSQIKIK
jgi:hypothetical protein